MNIPVQKIVDQLKLSIGVYLDALGTNKDQLQEFIAKLQPDIELQLAGATAGQPLAVENLKHLGAQIAGKSLEIGWTLIDDEMVAVQQIVLTAVQVAISMALAA